jgi:formamidase
VRIGAERIHNRWHPDVEPVASVAPGSAVTIETRDGLDGQLGRDSVHGDALEIARGVIHPLTGPIHVERAEPGDVLEVEFLEYETADFGITCVLPGFGLLADELPGPYLVKWEISDGAARSEDMPGITIAGGAFAGVAGVAPSHDLLEEIRRREGAIAERGGPVSAPFPEHAVPQSAAGGLRTIPPRETGGNLDIRQLVAGSRLYLPVSVPGALFSIGDLHFAQGDGEVCGTGIEVAGAATVRLQVLHSPGWRGRFPWFETPARPAAERASVATTGIPVDSAMDVGAAARAAVVELIDYLVARRGLSREQAYVLCSVAADLRLSEVVDVPNPLVAAVLPLDVFSVRA